MRAQTGSHLAQYLVSCSVTKAVIDRLETIEIDKGQQHRVVRVWCLRDVVG